MSYHLLSPREEEIIQLIIQGRTDRQIAYLLKISQRTVNVYVGRIYRKLGVSSRCEAVVAYLLVIEPNLGNRLFGVQKNTYLKIVGE